MTLTPAEYYRALEARDARFDGIFFVGVTSTRIYCRPICRAPKPRADRCRYFSTAAAAERRGFRPCLRCRPELSPGSAPGVSADAVRRLAAAAAERIAAGALDELGVDRLAADLGVSARHLRRVVERELGASPVELAQTHRLLTAKRLLTDSRLPVTQVAFASGFGSIRRLNALFRERYRLSPAALRRSVRTPARRRDDAASGLTLSLSYRAPYDWGAMLGWLAPRATPDVELVTAGRYRRAVRIGEHHGVVTVGAEPNAPALRVELSPSLLAVLVPLLTRLRRLFDLDADPAIVREHLALDPWLEGLVERRPGLRVAGAMDGFDLALLAVLGQQVSVRGASTLAGRLAALLGEPLAPELAGDGIARVPVTAERLADAGESKVAGIGLPRARAATVIALARAVAAGRLDLAPGGDIGHTRSALMELPGVGEWTAEYILMRATRWPDAFPAGDLGLRKAAGGISAAQLRRRAESWRPWRSYAAAHLWQILTDGNS
jgi:AraC family transcriptional regulator, regulatory protein of adaptative response / DNA-3-methyladenine glycosylase II